MEALRKTLEWIFLREDVEEVLRKGLLPAYYCRREYVIRLRESFPTLTLDQIETVLHQLDDVWMQAGTSTQCRYVEGRPSVFNTLLHFTHESLSILHNEPCVKYDCLLRWHEVTSWLTEDLFTTSYMAARDLAFSRNRAGFSWKACIDHDNTALNCLFNRPMAELHSHLKGASLNFELNWLSLMNKPWQRAAEFKVFAASQNPKLDDSLGARKRESLYYLVIKAAAIRLHLLMAQLGMKPRKEKDILSLIHAQNLSEQKIYLESLKTEISVVKYLYSKRFDTLIPDYAITGSCCNENNLHAYTILVGERAMMYRAFRAIYDRDYEAMDDTLFYAYIVIKNKFRQELLQTNAYKGFANFGIYERRKEGFITEGSLYERMLPGEAVASYFEGKSKDSYLEVRITPKSYVFQLDESIKKLINDIGTINIDDQAKENYRLILHFIKVRDDYKYGPRHKSLRDSVRRSSIALVRWRNFEYNKNAGRVVGIDAANSELYCRPEVFSQAYRFCRQYSWNHLNKKPVSLHFTYHVGEDFYDIIDGLRAVWEAIHFLGLGRGDRIGHGLVLGTDVKHYYTLKRGLVYLPKQVLLDNIAWILHEADFASPGEKLYRDLCDLFQRLVQEIYKQKPLLDDYYQSICLRGDNPESYKETGTYVTKWNQLDRNEDELAVEARKNEMAKGLYKQYHYNPEVVRKGAAVMEFKMSEALAGVVEGVRLRMLHFVEELGIAIETNPTSNLKIGDFPAYDAHPLMEFNNVGLDRGGLYRGISVSINTDDRGVFGTSLEREFSLVAAALEKQYKNGESSVPPRVIYEWLDKVRGMAFEQKFS